ncbi:Outer membrane protein assembly factor BamC precursor [Gammaproteobacteria bacterium MOLA455]|nr:Outer membrane protein assembly factor BamC precursor [Gammaproteobacteria bacterium MOLA455]
MKRLISALNVVVILSLTGCGWLGLRDRSDDYLLAEETAVTVVPQGLDNAVLGQIYPIPQIPVTSVELVEFDVPRPQPASVNTFEQSVKIQSLEGRRWVLINVPPSEVWPRVRNVLNRNGVPAALADGSEGIIETVWVKFNSDEENSHRFRFQISPGVQLDSAEISAVHNQAARSQEDQAQWPKSSDDDQREKDMLSLLANDLAASADYASVSLLAQDIGGDAKVEVVTPEVSDPFILAKLSFDRTWASMLYSADRGGFVIVDQNRSAGVVFVNYTPESTEEPGFFARLFSGSEEILEANYRILVEAVGANVEIRIVGSEGQGLNKAETLRLLKILRSNMS